MVANFLRYPDAAAYLGMSVANLRKWVEAKRVPLHKVGRHVFFDPADLDAIIANGRVEAKKEVA